MEGDRLLESNRALARLESNKIWRGEAPSARHRALMSGYLFNLWRGPNAVQRMIADDITIWLDLGMIEHAMELLVVLRQFSSDRAPPMEPAKE